MVRLSALVLLAALLVAVAANRSSFRGKCPINLGKTPFDPRKMAGEWFIQAGTPLFGEQLSRCARFTVRPRLEGHELFYDIQYNALSPRDGKPYALESKSQAYNPHRGALSLGVWRRAGTEEYSEPFGQSVVATDYKTFAVFLACRPVYDPSTRTFQRALAAQVWGRSASMDDDARRALADLLSSYDVAREDIKMADQDNCSYAY
ncbi:hypothetical protein R5R35_008889 [Gryllus longicercus]|uniref:Accessory gland protein n=1 Tax=Gryllus longicercus TaxID=2509291 RepID=A0AAN9VC96_9ORTH